MSCCFARMMLSALALALSIATAAANERVGNRLFAATLAIDDPGANDELALPTVSTFRTGDDPSFRQFDLSGAYAKTITEDFAIGIRSTWNRIDRPGGPTMTGASGFENLETSFKYRFYKNPEREFVFSAALNIEWDGTGSERIGAEPFNVYTPTIYFGKGFGDLPQGMGWARPFAVTGQLGYAIPGTSSHTVAETGPDTGVQTFDTEFNPKVLVWGGSLQYSMAYLKSEVVDLDLPEFVNQLVPIVEASLQTPVANTRTSGTVTKGTINPGIAWIGKSVQFAVEAVLPINRESGRGVGVIAQLHFHLDDIFPGTIGRPLFPRSTVSKRDRSSD